MDGAGGEDRNTGEGPQKIRGLNWGLIFDLVGCEVMGLVLLVWKIALLGFNVVIILFGLPYVACIVILLFSGMWAEKKAPNGSTNSGASWRSWIQESILIMLYLRKAVRFRKLWREDGKGAAGGMEEDLWKTLLTQCYEDRIVYSVRNCGIAIVSVWIHISTRAESGLEQCSMDDVCTMLIIIWTLVSTSVAATWYEFRYRENNSRHDHTCSAPGCGNYIYLFLIHLCRLCWILHFMAFSTLLMQWVAPILLLAFLAYNIISHPLMLQSCLPCFLSTVPESPQQLPEILSPEHFLFTSPTILAYSVGSTGLNRFGRFLLIFKDLFLMLCGQIVLSFVSAHTEDHRVREVPYVCRKEKEPKRVIEAFTFDRRGVREGVDFFRIIEHETDSPPYYIPLPFLKYDVVGTVILLMYALLLLGYWGYAHVVKLTRRVVVRDTLVGNTSAVALLTCDGSIAEVQGPCSVIVPCEEIVFFPHQAVEFRISMETD